MAWRRIALWGLLVAAFAVVALLAVRGRPTPSEPLPVLGQVPDFRLTERDGGEVSRATLAGQPWVADFIFTRCVISCPRMTAQMARLRQAVPAETGLRLVSFSVDPDYDTPAVLASYAEAHGIRGRDWLLLTGPRAAIRALSIEGFKLSLEEAPAPAPGDAPASEPILHSTRFVLVDKGGRIRGYYEGFLTESFGRLQRDARALLAEPASGPEGAP